MRGYIIPGPFRGFDLKFDLILLFLSLWFLFRFFVVGLFIRLGFEIKVLLMGLLVSGEKIPGLKQS